MSIAGNSNNWNVAFGQGFYDGWATDVYRGRVGSTSTSQPFVTASAPNADLTHVVITHGTDGQQTIFVNGVAQYSIQAAGNLSSWQDYPMFLANESGLNRPWQGSYRLVVFQDRALTSSEVSQNYLAGATTNARPSVNAGPDRTVEVGTPITLTATATDDGLPDPPAALSRQWRSVSGPAAPVITSPTQSTTTVTLPVAGTYVLAFDANDGALTGTDQITLVAAANTAPTVSAGPDANAEFGGPITLTGTASDDGLPTGSTLNTTWTRVSGPGTANITTPTALTTQATVTAAGQHVFRLQATDGTLTTNDTVTITITTNTAPVVNAGADSTTAVNQPAQLVWVRCRTMGSRPGSIAVERRGVRCPDRATTTFGRQDVDLRRRRRSRRSAPMCSNSPLSDGVSDHAGSCHRRGHRRVESAGADNLAGWWIVRPLKHGRECPADLTRQHSSVHGRRKRSNRHLSGNSAPASCSERQPR